MQDANSEQSDAPKSDPRESDPLDFDAVESVSNAKRGKLPSAELYRSRIRSFAFCLLFMAVWTAWGWLARKEPSDATAIPSRFVVDLNVATEPELNLLPGVGPKLAQDILEYREKCGGFESVEELTKIRGIKEGRLLALRKYLQVGPSKER